MKHPRKPKRPINRRSLKAVREAFRRFQAKHGVIVKNAKDRARGWRGWSFRNRNAQDDRAGINDDQ